MPGQLSATQRGYSIDLRAFRAFTDKPLRQITAGDLQAFAETLGHLAPASQARRLSAVKSLFTNAHQQGYLQFDVGRMVPLPAVKDRLAERIMSEADMQRLLWLEKHPRNAAMLRLFYLAGLRLSELYALTWRDFADRDNGEGQITVLGKGGKTRAVLLTADIWSRLMALRRDAGPESPVFRSRQGNPVSKMQIHRIVKRAARRAGMKVPVSAHWFRHAHVSHALDRNCPVQIVMGTVGHASLQTTTRYTHVRPGDSSARYLSA